MLRAERRAGEMLKESEKIRTGNPQWRHDVSIEEIETLDNLGIKKQESKHWQAISRIPEKITT